MKAIKGLKTKEKELVKLGKEKGFLTEKEIKETLEGIEITEEVIVHINEVLEKNNITIGEDENNGTAQPSKKVESMKEIKGLEERKQELVKLGKEKGNLTFEDLAAALKGLDVDADNLDDIYNDLINSLNDINEKHIKIFDMLNYNLNR